MSLWEVLPTFYDNAGQLVSATDLNALRTAAGLLDRWTYQSVPVFDSSAGVDTNTPGYENSDTPLRIWWGAVRFVGTETTLTVEMKGAKSSAESIKVYWNGTDATGSGTLAMTLTPPASFGAFSGTFTLPGGLTAGAVYQIEIRAEGVHTTAADWEVQDVYLSSITKSGWPGVPTFSASTVNAANLNLLAAAAQWLYDRLRLVPLVPHLGLFYNLGPFKDPASGDPQHTDRPMFYGSVGKYYGNNILRIAGTVQSLTTTGWLFKVYLNGSLAYTSPTYGVGTQNIYVPLSLASYTLGSRVSVAITASATNGGTANPSRFTYWTLSILRAEPDATGWGYASLPAAFVGPAVGTSTWSTVVAALNTIATIVGNAKTRVDGRPELWARSRALRRHFSRNTFTEHLLVARARPHFPQRVGNELFVKGTGTEIQWGLFQSPTIDQNYNGFDTWSYSQKQSASDSANGQLIYLDDLPGLDVGSAYAIFNDALYCAEYLG